MNRNLFFLSSIIPCADETGAPDGAPARASKKPNSCVTPKAHSIDAPYVRLNHGLLPSLALRLFCSLWFFYF